MKSHVNNKQANGIELLRVLVTSQTGMQLACKIQLRANPTIAQAPTQIDSFN